MNKSAIKSFAVRARKKLIEDITQKAYELGIAKEEVMDIEKFEGGFKIKGRENSRIYKEYEIKQRERLIEKIKEKGFEQVIEEVAYAWFNRFIALRFMEVNDYLPIGVRVLSSVDKNKKEPDIIKEALNFVEELDLNREIVYRLQENNEIEDLYKYLLVKQCNQLGKIMPTVFEKIADYTELLLPDNLLAEGSVIRDLVESIDEEDYKDQVEIIGWLYQYYISEKKDEVFAGLKKNKKITKENIPAATQLFTPKWIVKYMVENSLGRLWLESHPDEELKSKWKYYLEEAEQEPEVQKKLEELKNPNLSPEDIKILDPAMGSGHILVYAFDVLYDIYLKAGYSEREIPRLILEKNLYGLDIDDRAGQLATFALMMKARSKNRRIFRRPIQLNVCSIQESNGIPKEVIDYFVKEDEALRRNVEYLIEVFNDAKEYGSILEVKKIDFDAIERRIEEIRNGEIINLFEFQYKEKILEKLPQLIKQARIMSEKYDVVCTNPPYMGFKGMNEKLSSYINSYYPNSKSDLYAVFIEKNLKYCGNRKYVSMITQQSWMYLYSFEKLRKLILEGVIINSLIHLGPNAFEEISGEVVQACTFILKKTKLNTFKPIIVDLIKEKNSLEKEKKYFDNNSCIFKKLSQKDYLEVPSYTISYKISDKVLSLFKAEQLIGNIADVKRGPSLPSIQKNILKWFEVDINNILLEDIPIKDNIVYNWVLCTRSGSKKRWYENIDEIIKYKILKEINNYKYQSVNGIVWPDIRFGNTKFCGRLKNQNVAFESGVNIISTDSEKLRLMLYAFLNCKICEDFLIDIVVGQHFSPIYLSRVPFINVENIYIIEYVKKIEDIINKHIVFDETNINFKKQYSINFKEETQINKIYTKYSSQIDEMIKKLIDIETSINKEFMHMFDLNDKKYLEIDKEYLPIKKDGCREFIKSFISYAVGCMFGRYSLDEEGLIYAGGEFKDKFKIENGQLMINTKEGWKKSSIDVTMDNVIPITDDDYFEDDIVNRFVEFVKVAFGEKTLEENLDYIAETLGKKTNETSRQTIRRYFLKDFYKDHVKTYKKRPIYWLFDSGKENGFKALIYMHRYDSSTVARVRTDYLHKLQKKYEAEVKRLDILIDSDISTREKTAARKKKEKINRQILECMAYDQVIAYIANKRIEIDLDDGVKVNYAKFQGIEIPQGERKKPLKANLLAKI
ncbi:restriction endonuclease [Caloranaerobacter sp. TR13]|uniref:BREX-1 system adenine-specific DNA-methyltransferase PglX n=1 Tax=Caloranaerobacter sp. TR13 TaxID=1302151 RepID=UPI0006D3E6D2|nr:BREX-1 system adenine-specific DNA-methyltransferase PglX [Caloranaerobacter sp. TR13]KPU27968.1 restriction endonuclease [Caloranaerobacter sp. TR13]